MKIANKKEIARVGRPSVRSCTFRRSDKHITFSVKTAMDLNIKIGCKVSFVVKDKDLYLCPGTIDGYSVFGYKNGDKFTSFACTSKDTVISLLDSVNAVKVAVFMIAANSELVNGQKCYKVIHTPLRID